MVTTFWMVSISARRDRVVFVSEELFDNCATVRLYLTSLGFCVETRCGMKRGVVLAAVVSAEDG
jgi:hypothetical protein